MEDSLEPVIITVNSEPRGVLLNYERFRRMAEAERSCKRLALSLAVERMQRRSREAGLTPEDVDAEIERARLDKRERSKL